MPDNLPQKGDTLLFLDIETLPPDSGDPLWVKLVEQIKPNKGETEEDFDGRMKKMHYDAAMLSPLGRVWMIGYAFGSEEPEIISGDGSVQEEAGVIQRFWDAIKGCESEPWIIGHNVEGFDIPFLQVRAVKHKLPLLARKLGRYSTKPWDRRVLDTMKIWPRTGADRSAWESGLRGIGKLDTICSVLGVERQLGVMGPEVYDAYLRRDRIGVEKHLIADVKQVRDVFRLIWPLV